MSEIEHRVEGRRIVSPKYSEREFTEEEIARGVHRRFIGGYWDDGLRQVSFLTNNGLCPEHKFLDVGCGALRAGRHLVDLLAPGNYYGIDANLSLIKAGYEVELSDEQRSRLPVANLRANDRFDGDFGVQFDMAIAQSVFTHVSLNHIRLCLFRLGRVMRPGGTFFATFNEQPASTPIDKIIVRHEGGRPYLTEQNVFWFYRSDLQWASTFGPWRFRYIGDWGHPRRQMMVAFTRLSDEEAARVKAASAKGTRPFVVRLRRDVPGPLEPAVRAMARNELAKKVYRRLLGRRAERG
jgi:SAM-dependent methyltransferase